MATAPILRARLRICIAPAFLRAHGITNPELRRNSSPARLNPFDDSSSRSSTSSMPCLHGGAGRGRLLQRRLLRDAAGGDWQGRAGVSYYGALDGRCDTARSRASFSQRFTSAVHPFSCWRARATRRSASSRRRNSRRSSRCRVALRDQILSPVPWPRLRSHRQHRPQQCRGRLPDVRQRTPAFCVAEMPNAARCLLRHSSHWSKR